MSLPKLTIPTYNVTLPSGKTTTYRPFTVKERSILLLALQEDNIDGIYSTIKNLFTTCTNGDCSIDKMPIVDSEFLFVKIRSKSVGEDLELLHACECGKDNQFHVNLDKIQVEGAPPSKDIDLGDGNWLQMKYPTLKDSSILSEDPTEDEIVNVIAACIDNIIVGSAVYKAIDSTQAELKEFIENLTQAQLTSVEQFFAHLPKVVVEGSYQCTCGKENVVRVEGLQNFFG